MIPLWTLLDCLLLVYIAALATSLRRLPRRPDQWETLREGPQHNPQQLWSEYGHKAHSTHLWRLVSAVLLECGNQLAGHLEDHAQSGEDLDVCECFATVLMDLVANALLGSLHLHSDEHNKYNLGQGRDGHANHEVREAFLQFLVVAVVTPDLKSTVADHTKQNGRVKGEIRDGNGCKSHHIRSKHAERTSYIEQFAYLYLPSCELTNTVIKQKYIRVPSPSGSPSTSSSVENQHWHRRHDLRKCIL